MNEIDAILATYRIELKAAKRRVKELQDEISRLESKEQTRAAQLLRAPVAPKQPCPSCGSMEVYAIGMPNKGVMLVDGQGKSKRFGRR